MGRSIYCSKCKNEKEESVRNESYCKACKHARQKQSKIKKRINLGLPPELPVRKAYCESCIEKLALNEDIRGKCSECRKLAERDRREKQRVQQGLPAKSLRSSVLCIKCNEPKTDGRCLPCNNKVKAQRKAEKKKKLREEQGKRPWGSGRPLTCYDCNKVKENPSASFCNDCKNMKDRLNWKEVIAPRVNQKPVTLICECGKIKTSTRKFYCEECIVIRKLNRNREAARKRRKLLKQDGFILPAPRLTDNEKVIRKAARDYLNRLVKQGIVKRLNCEVCGSDKNIEAHHEDYERPLDVKWLCRVHHDEHHHIND